MKKLNWFTRLFMSWSSLQAYFAQDKNDSEAQELKVVKARLEAELSSTKERLDELKTWLNEKNIELQNKVSEIDQLKNEIQKTSTQRDSLLSEKQSSSEKILIKESEIQLLKDKVQSARNDMEILKTDISKKLDPLSKIEKTFFGQTGNKGKGMLGERQLEVILEKSGMSKDMWVKDLKVNSNIVEFAIKANTEDKWIPVDSKVLDAEYDEETNTYTINESYKSKVQTQVKEVAKYLSKTNTADYGLLVLQSDEIYMELFKQFPFFFEDMIKEHKIYICSPSSFVQFAWSVSQILDIYKRVHKDEKMYDEVIDILTTVNKLSTTLYKVHKDFNIAFETHYPTLQKRQNSLVKKLKKEDKIKELPNFNSQSNLIEMYDDEE